MLRNRGLTGFIFLFFSRSFFWDSYEGMQGHRLRIQDLIDVKVCSCL